MVGFLSGSRSGGTGPWPRLSRGNLPLGVCVSTRPRPTGERTGNRST